MYSRAYVEITNICNRSCSFCAGHDREPRRMSADEFDLITDKLVGFTEYLYYHLMGEPTTHPLLCDFIKTASCKGFKSVITTNGTLLPRIGERLISSGVYKVNISVHSFESGTEREYLDYINGCLDFADIASRAGVLVIMRLWNKGYDGGKNTDIEHMMRERFQDCEWKPASNGARIRHRLHLEYGDRFDWPDMNAPDGGSHVFCYALSDHFAILCDGTVVPCCLDRNADIPLGNILTDDLHSILSSPLATSIHQSFSTHTAPTPLCRRCGYARRFK